MYIHKFIPKYSIKGGLNTVNKGVFEFFLYSKDCTLMKMLQNKKSRAHEFNSGDKEDNSLLELHKANGKKARNSMTTKREIQMTAMKQERGKGVSA